MRLSAFCTPPAPPFVLLIISGMRNAFVGNFVSRSGARNAWEGVSGLFSKQFSGNYERLEQNVVPGE